MTLGVLCRDAGWVRLGLSTVLLAAVGALAGFMVIFMLFIPFDRSFFYAGMNYQSRTVVDSPQGGVSVRTGGEITVSPRLPENAEGMYLSSRTVSLASPLSNDAYARVLGASLIAGKISNDGVVVDEATLRGWGLDVGATILVHGDGGSPPCATVVTGVTRPFNVNKGAFGQVIVPAVVCAKQTRAAFAESGGQWVAYNLPGVARNTNADDALAAWGEGVSFGVLVWVICIMAGALWVLAVWRTAVQLSASTVVSALALVWIGASPRRLSRGAQLVLAAISSVASVGAVAAAQNVLLVSAHFYAQPALVLLVAAAMVSVALATSGLFYRGWPVSRRATGRKVKADHV